MSPQNNTLQEFNGEDNIFKKEPDLNDTESTIVIKLEDLLLETASEMRVDTSSWIKSASNHLLSRSSRNTANEISRNESEQQYPITSSTPTGSFVNQLVTTNKDLPQTIEESLTYKTSDQVIKSKRSGTSFGQNNRPKFLRGAVKKPTTPSVTGSRQTLATPNRRFFNGTMQSDVKKALESGSRFQHSITRGT
jgi:hypothetical protein